MRYETDKYDEEHCYSDYKPYIFTVLFESLCSLNRFIPLGKQSIQTITTGIYTGKINNISHNYTHIGSRSLC